MFVICGVRQGSRVADWESVLYVLSLLLDAHSQPAAVDLMDTQNILSAVAVAFQYCPLNTALSYVHILEQLSQGAWESMFLSFCNIFAGLGQERFKTLLLPYFKRYVTYINH